MLITVFAIYWSVFWDTYVGSLVYVAAFITEEALYVRDYGVEVLFSHLTHVTLVFATSILMFNLLTDGGLCLPPALGPGAHRHVHRGRLVTGRGAVLRERLSADDQQRLARGSAGHRRRHALLGQLHTAALCAPAGLGAALHVPLRDPAPEPVPAAGRVAARAANGPTIYAACLAVLGVPPPTAAIMDMGALWGCVFGAGLLPWLAASSV